MLDRRALLAAGAVTLALPACARPPALVIGDQTNGLLMLARERGDLDAVARVAWRSFPSGPPLLEAMGVGAVDLGGTGDAPPIVAQAQGAPIVYVAAQPVSGGAAAILVPRDSPLRSPRDLAGRRVAWLRGSSAQRFVGGALASAGLRLGDVEAVNLAPGDAAAAFAAGSLDAWAVWDPWFAQAELAHSARVLVAGRPLAQSVSFVLANRVTIATRGDDVRAVLDALAATARWATADRAGAAALIGRATGLDAAVAARVAARQDVALVPLTPALAARQQSLADALFADGTIPAKVAVRTAFWAGWRAAAR